MKRIKLPLLSLILFSALFVTCKKDKSEPPPPNPVAVYKFDNSAMNSVANNLHGQVAGVLSNTTDSFNTPNSAYRFGGDSFIRIPDSDILDFAGNQFTFAVWIRPVKTFQTYIIHKGEMPGAGGPYSLHIFPGRVAAFIRTTTDEQFSVEGVSEIQMNVWQHVAVTFSGDKLSVYYNGEQEGSTAVDRPLDVSDDNVAIGAYEWAFPAATWEGKMDNLRIYDKALTAGQVKNLYKNYNQ